MGNIENHLVLNPKIIKIGTINSAKATKIKEGTSPIPIGSENFISSANSLLILLHPCGNNIREKDTRKNSLPKS